MTAIGARQDNASLRGIPFWAPRDGQRCGVLIIGSRRADVFVATEVLISADTLGDEEAIRAWLADALHGHCSARAKLSGEAV